MKNKLPLIFFGLCLVYWSILAAYNVLGETATLQVNGGKLQAKNGKMVATTSQTVVTTTTTTTTTIPPEPGPELIVNGTFDSNLDGWTKGTEYGCTMIWQSGIPYGAEGHPTTNYMDMTVITGGGGVERTVRSKTLKTSNTNKVVIIKGTNAKASKTSKSVSTNLLVRPKDATPRPAGGGGGVDLVAVFYQDVYLATPGTYKLTVWSESWYVGTLTMNTYGVFIGGSTVRAGDWMWGPGFEFIDYDYVSGGSETVRVQFHLEAFTTEYFVEGHYYLDNVSLKKQP